ncbi:LytR/AlgR family response regulator transcription factor [Butyrivibrio fibrisolvens]|uniref:LytR/AlgR family response regulator transcription factor n=1 Tax=Butyrivibrio fibrisolvens TaxID=831 RepID=UPI000416C1D3|nr:LytTR family DNA-binding domain-containing protein [Butyrivibrio fibrisolvens]
MVYYLSLVDSMLETRMLKELVPDYAAKYTEDYWDFCYTEDFYEAMARLQEVKKHDILVWDTTVRGAGNKLLSLRKDNPTAFLFLFASSRTNPMLYVRAGIAPDALLLKPFDIVALDKVLEESFDLIRDRLSQSRGQLISVFTGHAQKYLQLDLIDFLEARDKKVFVRIKNQEYGLYETLDDLEKKLPDHFRRCHRSFIVNMLHADSIIISENVIIMKNGDAVPVSRTYKKEIKEYGIENE